MAVKLHEWGTDLRIYEGHVLESLRLMSDKSVHCVVTSDPYWGLRSYGEDIWEGGDQACDHRHRDWDGPKQTGAARSSHAAKADRMDRPVCSKCGAIRVGNIMDCDWPEVAYRPMPGLPEITVPVWRGAYGLEPTPEMYVGHSVLIRRELWRVMRDDAVQWLNLGDSYNGSGGAGGDYGPGGLKEGQPKYPGRRVGALKPKDLCMIPARVALALQADGWYLRSDVIWCLSGGTRVYAKTQKGEMPTTIKDLVRLKPKTVQLWNGQTWTQVLGWAQSPRPTKAYEIELRTGERIGCTAEHLWPTKQGNIRTDQLHLGDVIQTCRLPEPGIPKRPAGLEDDLVGWFVGLYLAEGSHDTTGTIQIAGHVKETERFNRLQQVAEAYQGTCRVHYPKGNSATICMDGPILNAILDTYVAGHDAKDKHLSVRCWQRTDAFLSAILQGYLSGDGHYDAPNNRYRLAFTNNDNWAADLRTLCARVGVSLRLKRAIHTFNGKKFRGYRGQIRFTVSDHHNNRPDGEIVAIRASRARQFWDISVADEPHIFALASGALTHNCKPNPMPESVTDRPTKAHEYLFLLAKSERYYYDADAIREPQKRIWDPEKNGGSLCGTDGRDKAVLGSKGRGDRNKSAPNPAGRNKRSVWEITTQPTPEAHFATFPEELPETCILAGTSPKACPLCGAPWARVTGTPIPVEGRGSGNVARKIATEGEMGRTNTHMGFAFPWRPTHTPTVGWRPTCACSENDGTGKCVVLDPFNGSGTTGRVARKHGRAYIGCELNPEYVAMTQRRLLSPVEILLLDPQPQAATEAEDGQRQARLF